MSCVAKVVDTINHPRYRYIVQRYTCIHSKHQELSYVHVWRGMKYCPRPKPERLVRSMPKMSSEISTSPAHGVNNKVHREICGGLDDETFQVIPSTTSLGTVIRPYSYHFVRPLQTTGKYRV